MIDVFMEDLNDFLHSRLKMLSAAQFINGVGELLLNEIANQFEEEGSRFGKPWEALKPSTIAQREKLNKYPGKILQVTGGLASSFTYKVEGNNIIFGTNKSYAVHLFYGTKNMPARPFFPTSLSDDVIEEINVLALKQLGL